MASTFVVVGASTGLGRATAQTLARRHRVIVAGRDVDRTRAAVPGAHAALRVDLGDLADVARFGAELSTHGAIDGIVCNAGVQHVEATVWTRDGLEESFAVNHLAHFAIVMDAVPRLAPGARVVLIGSGTIDPENPAARRFGFRGGRYTSAFALARGEADPAADAAQVARDRYATSKLCNLLTVAQLARRVPAARFSMFGFDPGVMPGTGLQRHQPVARRLLWHTAMRAIGLAMPRASTARRSATALAWLLTAPELAGTTGRYFDFRRREIFDWYGADRTDWGDDLYASSIELCGLDHDALAM